MVIHAQDIYQLISYQINGIYNGIYINDLDGFSQDLQDKSNAPTQEVPQSPVPVPLSQITL